MLNLTNDILLKHDVIKKTNISDDEKKYFKSLTFKIMGYGKSDRYPNLNIKDYHENYNNAIFKLHHIYLRSTYDQSCYDLQFYFNLCVQNNPYAVECYQRLIGVDLPQYITHTALGANDIDIKYRYKQYIENNEFDRNDTSIIIKEDQKFIMCKWFEYFTIGLYIRDLYTMIDQGVGTFEIVSHNFQKIINVKPAVK